MNSVGQRRKNYRYVLYDWPGAIGRRRRRRTTSTTTSTTPTIVMCDRAVRRTEPGKLLLSSMRRRTTTRHEATGRFWPQACRGTEQQQHQPWRWFEFHKLKHKDGEKRERERTRRLRAKPLAIHGIILIGRRAMVERQWRRWHIRPGRARMTEVATVSAGIVVCGINDN